MVQHILQRVLWIAPLILQAVILIAMVVRGLYKQLPYFFSYTAFVVLQSMTLLALYNHKNIYLYGFWFGELVSWILGLSVIYEIYANLLREYAALQKLGTILFWLAGFVLVMIAVWTAFNAPGSDQNRVYQALLTTERSLRIVQCGLLVALFVFASFFGLSWKNHLFGIALGFAIFVCIELAVVAIRAYSGASLNEFIIWLKSGSYALAILVWAVYVIKARRVEDLRALPKTELAAWNDTLQELLHR
jgi:hypothetical protein